jgi:hypothetical protein
MELPKLTTLRDKFFLAAYGKYAAYALAGGALATVVGVPLVMSATLTAGALIGFPPAYALTRPSSERVAREAQP